MLCRCHALLNVFQIITIIIKIKCIGQIISLEMENKSFALVDDSYLSKCYFSDEVKLISLWLYFTTKFMVIFSFYIVCLL